MSEGTFKAINESKLKTLIKQITNHSGTISTATGEIGSLVAKAVEKDHLDKTAFGIFRKLHKMSDEKLATTLAHLDHMIEVGGLQERADSVGEMFSRKPGEADETPEPEKDLRPRHLREQSAQRADEGNITQIGRGPLNPAKAH
jgi:hypothetical protein